MRLRALAVGVGSLWALCGGTRDARAFEREWHLGAAAGVSGGAGLTLSPAVGAYAAYGISDVFDLRLELTARGYRIGAQQDPNALVGMAGLCYKLDVLRWVPWAGVYLGYQQFLTAPRPELAFPQGGMALGIGGGLDYGVSRNLGLGVTVRFDDGLSASETNSFEALLRAEYRWGF